MQFEGDCDQIKCKCAPAIYESMQYSTIDRAKEQYIPVTYGLQLRETDRIVPRSSLAY